MKTTGAADIDITSLAIRAAASDTSLPVDGDLQGWRIENMEMVAMEEGNLSQLYAGDSFVFLYTYTSGRSQEFIVYFWQGRDSSQDEIACAAIYAQKLDDERGGKPVQVRVVQGKEPAHFRALFKGKHPGCAA